MIEVKGADSDGRKYAAWDPTAVKWRSGEKRMPRRKRAPGTQINIVRIILYDKVLW